MSLVGILLLYLGIGVLAATGTVTITRQRFSPRTEHLFFALALILIAAIYLVFVDHFQSAAIRVETWAVMGFAVLGLLGTRFPMLVILGYLAHGGWDLAHEVIAYSSSDLRSRLTLTPIPLAYGAFCAAFDWCIAGYVHGRRHQWRDRRSPPP